MKAIIQKSNNRVAFLFPDSANVVITERGLIRPVHALDVTTATYKVETVTAPDFEFVGGQYSWTPEFGWAVFDSEAVSARTAEELAAAKAAKREEINRARLAANRTSFSFMGKDIAVDDVSRSDIDGVSDQVLLTGSFPAGFPNAWKAMDNTYVAIPDIDTWRAFVTAMTTQGAVNFGRAQQRKAEIDAATTVEQVNAIVW
jgi:hypothetical protein